jgi:hypothetical protein
VPRRTRLRPHELVRQPDGLRVPTVARTLADCAPLLTVEALTCAVDHALHEGLVDTAAVAAAVVPGQRGVRNLRLALALADGRAESPAETLARLLCSRSCPTSCRRSSCVYGEGEKLARTTWADPRVPAGRRGGRPGRTRGTHMVVKAGRREPRGESARQVGPSVVPPGRAPAPAGRGPGRAIVTHPEQARRSPADPPRARHDHVRAAARVARDPCVRTASEVAPAPSPAERHDPLRPPSASRVIWSDSDQRHRARPARVPPSG